MHLKTFIKNSIMNFYILLEKNVAFIFLFLRMIQLYLLMSILEDG